jgi:hypothetical protein
VCPNEVVGGGGSRVAYTIPFLGHMWLSILAADTSTDRFASVFNFGHLDLPVPCFEAKGSVSVEMLSDGKSH